MRENERDRATFFRYLATKLKGLDILRHLHLSEVQDSIAHVFCNKDCPLRQEAEDGMCGREDCIRYTREFLKHCKAPLLTKSLGKLKLYGNENVFLCKLCGAPCIYIGPALAWFPPNFCPYDAQKDAEWKKIDRNDLFNAIREVDAK
ncbi:MULTISPECIES: hypothetical protein [unclassified Archaeoglobus]|jgi:hypothetical protein|uniref:hypothetical protein n=1 Tax=unclassified Archaeoglobus TaxID=2643606 RepID=UPI0025BD08CD|nr:MULTISPECIES: hypothetical protein [unclassified Archaeoglobus]